MLPQASKSVVTENDLMMYLATGLKHLRLMSLLMCLSMMLGVDYYQFTRPVYYSKAIIHFQPFVRPLDTESVWSDSNERAMYQALQSPEIMVRTAKRLGIKGNPRQIAEKYVKKVGMKKDSDRNIAVEVYAYTYPLARDWAKAMLDEFIARRDERRLEYAEHAITAMTEDLAQMKDRIDQNFNKKFDFKERNELDKLTLQLNELNEVPQELTIATHRLSAMDRIRAALNSAERDNVSKLALLDSLESETSTYLQQHMRGSGQGLQVNVGQIVPMHNEATGGNPSEIVVLPSMIPSTTESIKPWEALDKERHRIEREIAEKLKVFKSGHPQVVALNKQLNNVNKSLDSELDEALSHFNIEYANLLEKKTQLEAKLPEYRDISERHEKLVAQYKKFDSSQLKWDSFYDKESQKLDAIGYAMDKDRTTYDFVGHIELKNTPVTPQRLKTVAYSIIIGIALAIGIPFLLEYLNARVSDLEHAEETLQIRGLGVVPKISDVPIEKLLSDDGEKRYHDYHLRENFRLIRTNLVMNSENGALPQVIIVTSAMPQEGKTSVAANLAISFAAKGEKTLLIDGDLRRGRMHRLFGIPSKPGLSNFLNSEVSLDQISLSNGHSNLTLMPCGKRLNSASELLDNPAFSKLMQELRGKYQRIILDTPPVLGLSETIIMQREADGVLMVIWSDFTPMSSVKSAVQTLQVNGAKFSGFVLNRLDFSTLGNRYKYFYYAPLYYSNYQPLPAPAGNVDI